MTCEGLTSRRYSTRAWTCPLPLTSPVILHRRPRNGTTDGVRGHGTPRLRGWWFPTLGIGKYRSVRARGDPCRPSSARLSRQTNTSCCLRLGVCGVAVKLSHVGSDQLEGSFEGLSADGVSFIHRIQASCFDQHRWGLVRSSNLFAQRAPI